MAKIDDMMTLKAFSLYIDKIFTKYQIDTAGVRPLAQKTHRSLELYGKEHG